MSLINCPVCNQNTTQNIVILEKQPLSNLALASSYDQAKNSFGFDLEICMCKNCSHVYNKNASLDNISYKQEENGWIRYQNDMCSRSGGQRLSFYE